MAQFQAWLVLGFFLLSSSILEADAHSHAHGRRFGATSIGEKSISLAINPDKPGHKASQFGPLIGILSKPGSSIPEDGSGPVGNGHVSHIEASYAKFVEMGGGRPVPILYNSTEEEVEKIFKQINGIIFPGGAANLSLTDQFMTTARKLFNLTLEANDRGDHFPLHGTCLGFEMLGVIVTNDLNALDPCKMQNRPSTIKFMFPEARNHSLFREMDEELKDKLERLPLTFENHKLEGGCSAGNIVNRLGASFESITEKRNGFFFLKPASLALLPSLTTALDQYGKAYVSTVEARRYPITATMWHPEKNAFEWGISDIPHSKDAVRVTQAAANFIVSEARKNHHKPESLEEEQKLLIYNYCPVYSQKLGSEFTQIYVFDDRTPTGVSVAAQ